MVSSQSNKNIKSWKRKKFRKSEAVHRLRASDRFLLLKNNSNNINPNLRLSEDEDNWFVEQMYFPVNKTPLSFTAPRLYKIAEAVDRLFDLNLFHGDLCFSNISFDNQNHLLLFDWEVILERFKKNKFSLRTTPYCLHPEDHKLQKISRLTDIFGIAALTIISIDGSVWRRHLSYDKDSRQKLADYINDIPNFSNVELVDRILHKIL